MLHRLTHSSVCVSCEFTLRIAQASSTYALSFIMFQSWRANGSWLLNASKKTRVHLRSLTILNEKLIKVFALMSSAADAASASEWPTARPEDSIRRILATNRRTGAAAHVNGVTRSIYHASDQDNGRHSS
jgi:hypothetical protein